MNEKPAFDGFVISGVLHTVDSTKAYVLYT